MFILSILSMIRLLPGAHADYHSTGPARKDMSATNQSSPFYTALERALDQRGTKIEDICPPDDQIARRVLHDYGAMFVAHEAVVPPPMCVFADEDAVTQFQKAAGRATATIVDALIELQPAAMTALLRARAAARDEGLDITPRDGAEAARRSYADTVRLWNSRFFPALDHWIRAGRLTQPETEILARAADEPTSGGSPGTGAGRNILQQRLFEIRALLDRRARNLAAHRYAGFRRE